MNLNTLNIKYFATTFLLVFICVMNNLNAQNTLNRDKIEIIIGSYKYENNAYLHKIKLKKKGFKGVRVLPKKMEKKAQQKAKERTSVLYTCTRYALGPGSGRRS